MIKTIKEVNRRACYRSTERELKHIYAATERIMWSDMDTFIACHKNGSLDHLFERQAALIQRKMELEKELFTL